MTLTGVQGLFYYAEMALGSPPQKLQLVLDTGSSDLWVLSATSPFCQCQELDLCSGSRTYDANASSTYAYLNSDFDILYADYQNSRGDYALETVSIGGRQLTGVQFGIGYNTSSPFGVLGIGLKANEAVTDSEERYANLPQLMVEQGLIQSSAYSLWLDDRESSTGTILFGGVDTDKYHGTLQTLPIQQLNGEYIGFLVTLSGLNVSVNGRSRSLHQNLPITVDLDSGTSFTRLPIDLLDEIFEALDTPYEPLRGAAIVNCSLAYSDISINFTFTSVTITVPIDELVFQAKTSDGELLTHDDGSPECEFGIVPSDEAGGPILGDTFLRSAYVVYDLANNQISLAQTNTDARTSHIVEIGRGRSSVPNASIVASPVQASLIPLFGTGLDGPAATGQLEAASAEDAASAGSTLVRQLFVTLVCVVVAFAFA